MLDDSFVIVGAKRTPMGAFLGELAGVSAPRLGAVAIAGALEQASVDPDSVGEVLMGNVLSAGLGQAPARQAALAAGMSSAVPCTTVSKVCGSGMKAVMLACDLVRGGSAGIVVAGGMESMSNAPYLLPKARAGHRIGHDRILDHMMLDGLEDAYEIAPDGARRSMGTFGCAMAVSMIPLLLAGNLPLLAVALFVAGLSIAPTMVTTMALVEAHVPRTKLTEGMTWTGTGLAIGVALGSSAAGWVVDASGAEAGYVVPVVSGALAVAVGLLGHRRLRRPAPNREGQRERDDSSGVGERQDGGQPVA